MEFTAMLNGLAAKDTKDGNRIELKLTVQFDAALFAELGDSFADQVHVQVTKSQQTLEFKGKPDVGDA